MAQISGNTKKVYSFIFNQLNHKKSAPTIREISLSLNLSTRKVLSALRELEDALIVKRSPYRSRSIELITTLNEETGKPEEQWTSIPILGTAPGGPFLIAEQNFEDYISVPLRLIKGKKDVFLLRVTGNSMSPYLEDGDLALIRNIEAKSGDIVVAVTQGPSTEYEATIKEYYLHGSQVMLNPLNKEYKPIIGTIDTIQVQGVVVGAIKHFNE